MGLAPWTLVRAAFLIPAALREGAGGEEGRQRKICEGGGGRQEQEEVSVHYKVCLSVMGMPSRVRLAA